MNTNHTTTQKENPVQPSYLRHKRQRFWQILAPIGAGVVLLVAAMTLIILMATKGGSGANVSGWADTSLIWLILPVLAVAVVIAVLLFALVFVLARTLKVLPVYTGLVQQYVSLVADRIQYFAGKLVDPIIGIRSRLAGIKAVSGKRNKG